MLLSSLLFRRSVGVLALAVFAVGCNQGDERLIEKARIEGKESAKAELQAQLDAKDQLVEKARAEATATAKAELQAQIENIDLLTQKARAEGKAQAEAELAAQNGNLATKAQQMEADLANRHLFYQAARGTYEGSLTTERGEFKVRITLVPSLPPFLGTRTRQLEEIASDINNLYFNAQVVQWNPANRLSSVGCRVENLRPDTNKGELSIAATSCPNLYQLKIADEEVERVSTEATGAKPDGKVLAREVATSIREGRIAEVTEIRGEVHPTTNASIYSLVVKRTSR